MVSNPQAVPDKEYYDNNNEKQPANIDYHVATYKLTISKPGVLIPTSVSPGIQLKGTSQVQD